MTSTTSFSGKTILVTGGGGGLGLAVAEAFYISGGTVAIVDINADLCQAFEKSHDPSRSIAIQCDITQEDLVSALFTELTAKFSKVDILINNAGIVDRLEPVGTCDKKIWDRVMAVNLTAPMLMAKEAVSNMLKHDIEGSIVNIGSIASVHGGTAEISREYQHAARVLELGQIRVEVTLYIAQTTIVSDCMKTDCPDERVAYTTSKHGLVGLTKSTAAFYADRKIRCNLVLPVPMKTNIMTGLADGYSEEGYALMMKGLPMGMVDVEKVAQIVTFLASDAASTVNGASIGSDNGWMAH